MAVTFPGEIPAEREKAGAGYATCKQVRARTSLTTVISTALRFPQRNMRRMLTITDQTWLESWSLFCHYIRIAEGRTLRYLLAAVSKSFTRLKLCPRYWDTLEVLVLQIHRSLRVRKKEHKEPPLPTQIATGGLTKRIGRTTIQQTSPPSKHHMENEVVTWH